MENNNQANEAHERKKPSALNVFVLLVLGVIGIVIIGIGSCSLFVVSKMAAVSGGSGLPASTWIPFTGLAIIGLLFVLVTIQKLWLTSKKEQAEKKEQADLSLRASSAARAVQLLASHTNPNGWKIPFSFAVLNSGNVQANNWRIWFTCRDRDSFVQFDKSLPNPHEYPKNALTGRIDSFVYSRGATDAVKPHEPCQLEGVATLIVTGQPESVTVDYKLDADGMETRTGTIGFQLDWARNTGSIDFNEASGETGVSSILPNPVADDTVDD